MDQLFHPFTPEVFKRETGLEASDNEAVYLRWLNAQVNYANFQNMKEMNSLLKEILSELKEAAGK